MLIVISGLPGTGKTAVAAGVAARLRAVHLSIDTVEDAMLGAGLAPGWQTGVAAYEATRAAAEQNLALGRDVVVDAVNDSEPARQTWRRAAERAAAAAGTDCGGGERCRAGGMARVTSARRGIGGGSGGLQRV